MDELIFNDGAIYQLSKIENPVGKQIDLIYCELDHYWTRKGEVSTSTVNTGNGILFHDHNINKTYELDYSQVFELVTALKKLEVINESSSIN